jgi:hypothetical protein
MEVYKRQAFAKLSETWPWRLRSVARPTGANDAESGLAQPFSDDLSYIHLLLITTVDGDAAFNRHGLRLATSSIICGEFKYGAAALFDLRAGVKFAIVSRADPARDTGLNPRVLAGRLNLART